MSLPPEFETYRNAVEELPPPSPPPPPLLEQLKSPNPRAMIDSTDAMDFIRGILLRILLCRNSCSILRNCEMIGQPYGWGVLSAATGDITPGCAGIWLRRTCVAQNGNLAGADGPCHQQESTEQSRRYSFGTAPEVRFGTALDLAEHSCGRRSYLVLSRHAAQTGTGLRTLARR